MNNQIIFFLIGDSNPLSNWEYKDNPSLSLFMVLFSVLIAVYLMNLLIGLLGNAIEEENNRASYFTQKAKVFKKFHNIYIFFIYMYFLISILILLLKKKYRFW